MEEKSLAKHLIVELGHRVYPRLRINPWGDSSVFEARTRICPLRLIARGARNSNDSSARKQVGDVLDVIARPQDMEESAVTSADLPGARVATFHPGRGLEISV